MKFLKEKKWSLQDSTVPETGLSLKAGWDLRWQGRTGEKFRTESFPREDFKLERNKRICLSLVITGGRRKIKYSLVRKECKFWMKNEGTKWSSCCWYLFLLKYPTLGSTLIHGEWSQVPFNPHPVGHCLTAPCGRHFYLHLTDTESDAVQRWHSRGSI